MNHHDHHRHHGVVKEANIHTHHHDEHANHMGHMVRFNVVDTTNQSTGMENMGHIIPMDNANFSIHVPFTEHSNRMNNSSHSGHMERSSQSNHITNSNHKDHIGHSSNMEHMGHMTAHGTFSFFTETAFIVESIHINTLTGIIVAMVFSMAIAVLYETLNILAHARRHKFAGNIRKAQSYTHPNLEHGITTLVRVASVCLGYLMMLCVMTMNMWLFLAIILGSGLGHLFIRPIILRKFDGGVSHMISENEITVGEIEPLSDRVDDYDKSDANSNGCLIEKTPLNIDHENSFEEA